MAPSRNLRYLDPSAPINERVRDFMSRLTLDEKIHQFWGGWPIKGKEKLFVGGPMGWTETLHGAANTGIATVFPEPIALGATFDPLLIKRMAAAISDEVRAKYHASLGGNSRWPMAGLLCGAPTVNIFRDPRWGRGQEGYGEDPVLMARLAVAYVKGLQGDDPRYLKVISCLKHFGAHSGPERDRHNFNVKVGLKDLYETYFPAFEAGVRAGASAVMGAYTLLNGVHCCANPWLLKKVLRDDWGFKGFVITDSGATDDIYKSYKIAKNAMEAGALACKGGCDMGGGPSRYLADAVRKGLCTEADVDEAVKNCLTVRFHLGLFDPPEKVPYSRIPVSVVNCKKHRALAYETAVKSMVLLKNRDGLLPLGPQARRLFVTGPMAFDGDVMLGQYFAVNNRVTTFLEGILDRAGNTRSVNYRKGCPAFQPRINPLDLVTNMAAHYDVTIAVMGISTLFEGEEFEPILSEDIGDRTYIGLPPHQRKYFAGLCAKAHEKGKKIILVVTSGSAIAEPELYDMADAVIYAWYPGEEGGNALADILFGAASPSGRLPITIPYSLKDIPNYNDYRMANRTYRYMKAKPYYPFGFGLGYSKFAYSGLKLSAKSIPAGEKVVAEVTVKNAGASTATELAQLYITDCKATVPVPHYALKDFARVHLKPGASQKLRFTITPDMLALVDNQGQKRLEPGEFRITIGGACPSPRSMELGAPKPVAATLRVR